MKRRPPPDPESFRLRDIAVAAYGPSALFGLAEGAMLPVITLSALERGASLSTAAFIAALLGIGSILTNIPAGALTTRIGERWSMVLAAAASAVGLLLCILPFGLWVYGAGVFVLGSASAVFTLARQTYLTDMVPPRMRARALSTLGGSMRIGVFIGPFLSAAAMHFFGVTSAYVISLVAVIGAGLIAFTVPDLETRTPAAVHAAKSISTVTMFRTHWRTFLTLGTAVLLLSAIRQSRQIVIPLWATHIGLDESQASIIYGIAGAIDAAVFYPAGKVMDRYGRRAVAVPCMVLMGLSFVIMPMSGGFVALMLVAMLMGFANGLGSGIIMTLGADVSPAVGRATFLGVWREFADAGAGLGPVMLSTLTAVASLSVGVIATGCIGFAAAIAMWVWIPKRPPGYTGAIALPDPPPGQDPGATKPLS